MRRVDGSAGDADYGTIGTGYARYRRADPRILQAILDALGDARSVVNVGAGAGSYEPIDREVTAVEPSATMRAQRPADRPAVDAVAESLPFDDDAFDAAMTTFSVHQWPDLAAGLAELRRVATGPVVVLTCDPARLGPEWLAELAPEMLAAEARRYPPIDGIAALLGDAEVVDVPIPLDCTDGFSEAYFGRPELLLDPGARLANSAWAHVDAGVEPRFATDLERMLASGEWDRRFGALRTLPARTGSLRLVVGR